MKIKKINMKKIFILLLLLCACSHVDKNIETIQKNELQNKIEARNNLKNTVYYPLGIIGQVESVYLKDMISAFPARIDTGAETSSIDAINVKEFERDGEAWVSFDIENKLTKERRTFEKKIVRRTTIKRQQGGDEKRIVVNMEIKMGNQNFVKEFTLGNREKFKYQILIGRNILNGLAVVDVGLKNTLN